MTPFSTVPTGAPWAAGFRQELLSSRAHCPWFLRPTAPPKTFRLGSCPPARSPCLPPACSPAIDVRRRVGTPADRTRTPRPLAPGLKAQQSLLSLGIPGASVPHPIGRGCEHGRIRNSWAAFPNRGVGVLLREWKPRSHLSPSPLHPSSSPQLPRPSPHTAWGRGKSRRGGRCWLPKVTPLFPTPHRTSQADR